MQWGRIMIMSTVRKDTDGVLRFPVGIGRHLIDQQKVSLNDLWIAVAAGTVPKEDVLRFYLTTGYSVQGIYEVFRRIKITDARTEQLL